MTNPPVPPVYEDLTFHGPLSQLRADDLIRSLRPLPGQHVADLGCGWAELLLQILAAEPDATGYGIDQDATAVEQGRRTAADRGLADRVRLQVGDAAEWAGPADVVIVNGATQVFGGDPLEHTVKTLTAVRTRLRPGGRLLLGEGFWEHEPTDEQCHAMDVDRRQYRSLPDLIDLALAHGYRPLWVSRASRDEWDAFESGHALGWERWLAANPDAPDYAAIKERADGHRRAWLRGWRDVMGLAYLTLLIS